MWIFLQSHVYYLQISKGDVNTVFFFPRKVLRLFLDQLISYTFCVLQNPASDLHKLDKWKAEKHLEILEKIFGEHGDKFMFVPETPPSISSIERAYHVDGTSFFSAHGSTLSPREDVEIQQILDEMVNAGQLTIVDLNFAEDWLSQCNWAAGAFRRAGNPDSRKKMIRNAREEIGNAWVDKRLKRA